MGSGLQKGRRTQGGEALAVSVSELSVSAELEVNPGRRWYVLWTHSHCESLVQDQLTAKGFELFFPRTHRWARRNGLRHRIRVPLFPGYLFLHDAMDKRNYLEISKVRGLVSLLGERWDRLAAVPDADINAIHRVLESTATLLPYPYLREGQRVRITSGPLTDVEGILVRKKENKGLLVLSIDLLRRAAAVEVDCTQVAPV